MKKIYTKPQICVEAFTMDQPVASGCNANPADFDALLQLGYFANELTCRQVEDGVQWGTDTICYHTNATYGFKS